MPRQSSSISGIGGRGGASSAASNMQNWSALALLEPFWVSSTASACTSSMATREWPDESKAPHFMRDSMVRFLYVFGPIRSQKSKRSSKGPSFSLACMIASTQLLPTFFTAERPNRMVSPTAVKRCPLSLTSGGRTSIPIARAEAAQGFGDLQELLLVGRNAVGRLQDGLEARVAVPNAPGVVFATLEF